MRNLHFKTFSLTLVTLAVIVRGAFDPTLQAVELSKSEFEQIVVSHNERVAYVEVEKDGADFWGRRFIKVCLKDRPQVRFVVHSANSYEQDVAMLLAHQIHIRNVCLNLVPAFEILLFLLGTICLAKYFRFNQKHALLEN